MSQEIPAAITAIGLEEWYSSLSDPDRVRLRRYLDSDTSSAEAFLVDVMKKSMEDHNFGLSVTAGKFALTLDLDDYHRFMVRESYIDGLTNAGMYDDAKRECAANLDIFPEIRDRIIQENGGKLPETFMCRNRLIDIMVGVESDYDGATEILDAFAEIGIMDPEELPYRKQSLKIHRMQKTFDNLYTYRPKE
jgi:hypothetical protein